MDDMFLDVLGVTDLGGGCPTGLNGAGGAVDMSCISTFVLDKHMMVVGDDGQFNVRLSIANSLNVAMNNPAAIQAVTEDNIKAAMSAITAQLYRYSLLDLVAHSGEANPIVLSYRRADTKTVDEFMQVTNHAACLNVADQIWALFNQNPRARAKMAPEPSLAVMSLCAQYLHRHNCEGHAWYSDAKKGSVTQKILALAGANVDLFSDFQNVFGHDLWHILSNDTVNAIAMAIVGEENVLVDAGYLVEGVAVGEGATIESVLKVPDSTKDRLPADIVGLSSMLLFPPLLVSVMDIISFRSSLHSMDELRAGADMLAKSMLDAEFDRGQLLELRDALALTVAVCVGIGYTNSAVSDYIESHPSLVSFANRNELHVMRGKTIGSALKTLDINTDEVIAAIGALLDNATRAVKSGIGIAQEAAQLGDDDEEEGAL